jgi:pimeloyl-ACP methyl ester carboxylesterase
VRVRCLWLTVGLQIHGWSGSSKYFALNVPALAKTCRVVTLDLRFHGASDKPNWCAGMQAQAFPRVHKNDGFVQDHGLFEACLVGRHT